MFKKHLLFWILPIALLLVIGGCNSLQDKPAQNPLSSEPTLNPGDSLSSDNGGKEPTGMAASALPANWRDAVYREICYALSATCYYQGRWGQSTKTINWYGTWFRGDWDYNGQGEGIGGACKEFASTILRRATGNRYLLPSGYNYAGGDIGYCQPGDIIQRSNIYGTPHTAIVFAVLARDSYGRATQIDVIDANFIGGLGSGLIARHKLPSTNWPLWQFKVW